VVLHKVVFAQVIGSFRVSQMYDVSHSVCVSSAEFCFDVYLKILMDRNRISSSTSKQVAVEQLGVC